MGAQQVAVVYQDDAVAELNSIKSKQDRKKILTIVSLLKGANGKLTEPHVKKVQGATKLFELRPGGGKTLWRPLYARIAGSLVILAIGPEAQADQSGFDSAVSRAQRRAKADFGVDV